MLVFSTPLLPLFLCFLTSSTISADLLLLCHNQKLLAVEQICQPGTRAALEVFVLNFLRFPTWQILNLTEMQTLKNSDQTFQRSPLLPDINIVESPCVGRRNRQGPLGLAAYKLLVATRTLGQRNTTLEFSGQASKSSKEETSGVDSLPQVVGPS